MTKEIENLKKYMAQVVSIDNETIEKAVNYSKIENICKLEKYQNLLQEQPELVKRVSIQHLASYIGVLRETLSRICSKIKFNM